MSVHCWCLARDAFVIFNATARARGNLGLPRHGCGHVRKHKRGRLPPFVPLLVGTLDTPAWRALSHGAKALYISLRRRYSPNNHNNGRIYLSHRKARQEMRSGFVQIARWYDELQFYGFIVMPSHLGVEGHGTAARWRLTELGYMKEQATRDFQKWDGTLFGKPRPVPPTPKTKSRYGKSERTATEIQNTCATEIHNTATPERYGKPSQAENDGVMETRRRTRLPATYDHHSPLSASPYLVATIERQDARAKRAPQGAVASERGRTAAAGGPITRLIRR